ncbi:hypothetical protein BH10PSE18_BH10PSE18_42540 [soil metagenome]|jgi:hypothetical protein
MDISEITLSLRTMRANIVQSIRALRVDELQGAAQEEDQFFLRAALGEALSKQDVLDRIAQQFELPTESAKNLPALLAGITTAFYKAGKRKGFVIVLEQVPANQKFDKEDREQLLDVFRDASDYWAERKVPFRCFYSFS